MTDALITGVTGFAAYLAVVFVLLRTLDRVAPSQTVTLASAVVYVGTMAVASLVTIRVWFWPVSATYWFLTLCFLMIFGAVYKSVSFRVLLDLSRQPNRSDRYDALLSRSIEEDSYRDRVRVLVESGLASRDTAGLRLTPKGRRLAAVLAGLHRAYRIERSG
jgi:hypothetical protein